jgi:hypothetical protein
MSKGRLLPTKGSTARPASSYRATRRNWATRELKMIWRKLPREVDRHGSVRVIVQ